MTHKEISDREISTMLPLLSIEAEQRCAMLSEDNGALTADLREMRREASKYLLTI